MKEAMKLMAEKPKQTKGNDLRQKIERAWVVKQAMEAYEAEYNDLKLLIIKDMEEQKITELVVGEAKASVITSVERAVDIAKFKETVTPEVFEQSISITVTAAKKAIAEIYHDSVLIPTGYRTSFKLVRKGKKD